MASSMASLMANNSAVKILEPRESFQDNRVFKEGQNRADADDESDGSKDPSGY